MLRLLSDGNVSRRHSVIHLPDSSAAAAVVAEAAAAAGHSIDDTRAEREARRKGRHNYGPRCSEG